MRPDFDGIPPPENIWGPDMREWIRARTERGGLAELTCYDIHPPRPRLWERVSQKVRGIF